MPQSPLSVITDGYLDPKQVALGRLVLDVRNPGQNFCPHAVLHLRKSDISKATFSDLKSLSNANSSNQFAASLSKVLQIFAKESNSTFDDISTKKAIRHQLLNVDLKFESLFDNDDVKKWLEKVFVNSPIFMVVGLDTLQDASVRLKEEGSMEAGGQIQAPIKDALAPASLLPGGGDMLDLKVEGGHDSKHSIGTSFVATGERIVAVQYQKVIIGMSSSKTPKTIQGASLSKKTAWKSFGVARGGSKLDTIEVSLAEATTDEEVTEDMTVEASSTGPDGLFVILG